MKGLLLALLIIHPYLAHATAGGPSSCSFNQGHCPLDNQGRDHGFVQDYGYGGLTSTAAAALIQASSPVGTLVQALTTGPLNSECVWSLGAHAQTAGGVAWNGNCRDATRQETQTLQCAGVAGLGYSYDGNFNDILAINDQLDNVQEELVYQTAVNDIRAFTQCQDSLFNTYKTNAAVQEDLLKNAYAQFAAVKNALRGLMREQQALRNRLGDITADNMICGDGGFCMMSPSLSNDPEVKAIEANIDGLTGRINMLVSRVPMGNRDSMGKVLRDLVLSPNAVSETQFGNAYRAEMTNMAENVTTSLATIRAMTVGQGNGDVNYCVDREMKKNLVRSGQLQTTIERMGLKDSLSGFTCRAENRYGVAGEVITELALIPTYFVGYGAARLALKAGASTIRAVASAGRTLSTATRGAMLGLESADWAFATAAVIRDCNSDEFFARVQAQQGCDPMNEVGQMYEEASLAQCLSSALLPAASAMVGTGVRVISSRRLADAVPVSALDEVIEGGDFVATAQKREFFINRADSETITNSFRQRNISAGRPLTDAQLTSLTPKEKVSLFESMGNLALSPAQGRQFLDIINDAGGQLDTRAVNRLTEMLRGLDKTDQQINTILQRVRTNRLFETPRPTPQVAMAEANREALAEARTAGTPPTADELLDLADEVVHTNRRLLNRGTVTPSDVEFPQLTIQQQRATLDELEQSWRTSYPSEPFPSAAFAQARRRIDAGELRPSVATLGDGATPGSWRTAGSDLDLALAGHPFEAEWTATLNSLLAGQPLPLPAATRRELLLQISNSRNPAATAAQREQWRTLLRETNSCEVAP